jgi:hypothetical protein
MHLLTSVVKKSPHRPFLLWILVLIFSPFLHAQQALDAPGPDKAALQLLMKRIDELETRVRQLEAGKRDYAPAADERPPAPADLPPAPPNLLTPMQPAIPGSNTLASAQTPQTPAESDQRQADNVMTERMDMSKTLLRIRGFGDVSLHGDTQKGDTTSFSLGQLDLFVTSDISDKFKFLGEIVFEGGPDNFFGATLGEENTFSVDVERYLLQYSRNDYFNIAVGRGHTSIGYYNTAYHHSTWLQTTTGRPLLFEFEDRGGILPIHTVGATAFGSLPSGRFGLHYVAEVGNGRESRFPLSTEPVQNEISDQNHKAFNLALFARPEAIPGLQTGISVYRDILAPANAPKIGETIIAAHAVLIRPRYEWLNEALLDRHAPMGSSTAFHTPGFYSQLSRQYGSYRPYFRYQYINGAKNEPVFPDIGLRHGPSIGLRFDASEFVALKLQYDRTFLRNQPAVDGLNLQLGFTF